MRKGRNSLGIVAALFMLSIGNLLWHFEPLVRNPFPLAEAATPISPSGEAVVGGVAFPFTIVIDPGHGGADKGAEGPSGLAESRVALEIARKLSSILAERLGARVILTRSDDYALTIDDRASMANYHKADVFLSLHLAASNNSAAKGANIIVHGYDESGNTAVGAQLTIKGAASEAATKSSSDKESLRPWDSAQAAYEEPSALLAAAFRDNFKKSALDPEATIVRLPLSLLKGLTMPATMIEIAFITNPEEEAKLRKESYLDELAEILYISIRDFVRKP